MKTVVCCLKGKNVCCLKGKKQCSGCYTLAREQHIMRVYA